MNVLLDTNIVIYFLKGEKKVIENVSMAENIAISFITEIELKCYDAEPDSEYGWEKLFSERLFLAFHRNYKLEVRIARFHNPRFVISK